MSRGLGRSLRHIYEQAREPAGLAEGMVEPLVAALEAGQAAVPETFAIHSDILHAVADDDMAAVRRLFEELADGAFLRDGMAIRSFGPPDFSPVSRARYLRYAATDPDVPLALVAPGDTEYSDFRARVAQAIDLLRGAAPEFADEIHALVGEIVVATVDGGAPDGVFDGISVFDLWGALLINPRRHTTVLETAEVLVHEATHALLFGYCLDEPLVLNPIAERYASPVREDARPMDGVFHGTYVIAMLDLLLRRLAVSGMLPEHQRRDALDRVAQYAKPFAAGLQVIREQGILTATGKRVIDGAAAYMADASG